MELRQLKYFVVVAEELNFSRAATRLCISQPALSRQVKNLEAEVGNLLFLRQTDGLKLTEAGSFFLEQAKEILQQSQTTVQALQAQYMNRDEPLKIGYIPTTLQSFLGETLNRFGRVHPQVPIRLQERTANDQVTALRQGTIDVAFIGNAPAELESEFIIRCVRYVPVNAILPETHPLADQDSIRLIDLAHERFIGVSEETFPKCNEYTRNVCRRAGFTVNIWMSADTLGSMIALVGAGQGVALIPSEAADLPHPQVVFKPLNPPFFARSTAMWRKEVPAKSLEKFLRVLFNEQDIQDPIHLGNLPPALSAYLVDANPA
ncbi:LysR family transcriptional regulator [Cyanobacteria bacterium FACHB-63]|nr:LysR family transcriptional regulator [Cyanobacteria bacterium FACHB-63]